MRKTATATTTPASKTGSKLGRPPLPPEQRLSPHTVYFTDAQWASVQANGLEWLRGLVDGAARKGAGAH